MGCSYKLRPTIAGETAGDGTIATAALLEGGERDGGIAESIIVENKEGVQGRKRSSGGRIIKAYDSHLSDCTRRHKANALPC